jgi:hypothetical protein
MSGNARSVDYQTPLTKAANDGNMERARALIFNRHVDVNRKNEFGKTALMIASYRGGVDMVRLLVKAGANVNLRDRENQTALMIASAEGHLDIVRTLVEADAVVDQSTQDSDETALMMAADGGHLDVFRFLLSRGANPNKRSEGTLQHAWNYAEFSGHDAISRLRRSWATTGNQSKEIRRHMKRLYDDLGDSRRPLIRQGIDNFATKVGMADENRQKLHEAVEIVPAADFKSAIQRCIEWFLDRFKEFEARTGRRPVFGIGRFFINEKTKSSDWLEHKLIEALGSPLFYVDDKYGLHETPNLSANSPRSLPDFVVLLDDAVYSGLQLQEWYLNVNNALIKFFRTDAPALLIATAYASREGAERVRKNMSAKDKFFHAKTIRSTPHMQWIRKYGLRSNLQTLTKPIQRTMTVMPHKSPNSFSMGINGSAGHLAEFIARRTGDAIYKRFRNRGGI